MSTVASMMAALIAELDRQGDKDEPDTPDLYNRRDDKTGIDGTLNIRELAAAVLRAAWPWRPIKDVPADLGMFEQYLVSDGRYVDIASRDRGSWGFDNDQGSWVALDPQPSHWIALDDLHKPE